MPNELNIKLLPWQAKLLLEAAYELEEKWRHINNTSEDEDEVADVGNDLMDLITAREYLETEAIKAFGSWITDFDKTPIISQGSEKKTA